MTIQQIIYRPEQYAVTVIDTPERVDELTGETIPAVTHEETRTREVPIMQSVTVDMAPEEEAALAAIQIWAETTLPEATLQATFEDRVRALETLNVDTRLTSTEDISTRNAAMIDYVAMMADVELPEEEV